MKKSYIKLIIFTLFNIIILLLNSFIFKITNRYFLVLYIIGLLIIFKIILGLEKDRHRYTKNIIFEILIILLIYIILYYLLGIKIGFSQNKFYSLTNFIIPLLLYIVFKELLRYFIICKSSENILLIVLNTLFIIAIDLTIPFATNKLTSINEIYIFLALTILPIITENVLCTFLVYYFGYKPSIVFLIIKKLYVYIVPIVPNPNEYLYSIIEFLVPIIVLFLIVKSYKKYQDKEIKNNKPILILTTFITIILIYFISGYFKYYSIAIASDSMNPVIFKGDVVIVNKKYDNLLEGDIIAYSIENHVVVHRINKIIHDKKSKYIYTKGDANNSVDNYKVSIDSVIGVVVFKVPFIGYPTVLLSELM